MVIAGLLLVTLFPFYYTVLLSLRPLDAGPAGPGRAVVPPSEIDLGSYASVLASPEAGGQGFLTFMRNSALVALGTVAAHAAGRAARARTR